MIGTLYLHQNNKIKIDDIMRENKTKQNKKEMVKNTEREMHTKI